MSNAIVTLFGITMNVGETMKVFNINFKWSGLLIAIGFLAGVIYCLWRGKKFGLKDDTITDALILAVPAAVVGARLFYVLLNFSYFIGDLVGILRIWDGGFNLLGGVLFGGGAAYLYCRKKKISPLAMLDAAGPALLLGGAIAAWGNFFGRTGFGNVTKLKLMSFTISGQIVYVHPLFLYTFLLMLAGFVVLHLWSQKRTRDYDGQLFLMSAAVFSFVRMIIMPLEYSQYGVMLSFQPGRFLAAICLCIALVILVHNKLHRQHSPAALFANGGAAFPTNKKTKKGRYGTYYDDEINDETDELSIGASYDDLAAQAEENAENDNVLTQEDEDEGFVPFGEGIGQEKSDTEE